MMPLGAPSITKYGSLVRPDAQIVALRAQCARTALKAPPLSKNNNDRVLGRRGEDQGHGAMQIQCINKQSI